MGNVSAIPLSQQAGSPFRSGQVDRWPGVFVAGLPFALSLSHRLDSVQVGVRIRYGCCHLCRDLEGSATHSQSPQDWGRRGYQLSLASTYSTAGSEILALFLDPAHSAPAGRLWDCLYESAEVVGSLDRLGRIRAHAAFGSGPFIEELLELEVPFLIKGVCNRTAEKFSQKVTPTDWQQLDLFTRVSQLGLQPIPNCRHPVRVVLTELVTHRFDRFSYSHLYTSLEPDQADALALFDSSNARQRIEALFKETKQGLSLSHLRICSHRVLPDPVGHHF